MLRLYTYLLILFDQGDFVEYQRLLEYMKNFLCYRSIVLSTTSQMCQHMYYQM